MSYDEYDAARDEMYQRLSEELYPEHKEQAINEFTNDRLRSYYLANPLVARPAVAMMREAESLLTENHFGAALVFAAASTELFLKATLLRPVIYGLVHSEVLAEAIVENTLAQTGLERYTKLLNQLFQHLTSETLSQVQRHGGCKPLVYEINEMQKIRNNIVHRGEPVTREEAERSVDICRSTVVDILNPVLAVLGLEARKGEGIQSIENT